MSGTRTAAVPSPDRIRRTVWSSACQVGGDDSPRISMGITLTSAQRANQYHANAVHVPVRPVPIANARAMLCKSRTAGNAVQATIVRVIDRELRDIRGYVNLTLTARQHAALDRIGGR